MINKFFNNNITIIKNTGYLSFIEIIRMIMPFIALPYIIKTIGADNYGTVVFAQTIVSYFIVFINFGLDVSAVKNVSVNRHDKIILNKIVSSVLLIKLVLLILCSFILFLGIFFFPYLKTNRLLYCFVFISCFSEILFPVWFYQGIEKMKYITLIRFFSLVFYTISIFIFIRSKEDYVYVALLQSLGVLFSGMLSFYFLFKLEKIKLLIPEFFFVKKSFVESFPFFLSRLSVILNNNIAKILSGIFFSMHSVAALDIAQKIATVSIIPSQMLNQAAYPHIARTKNISFVRNFFLLNIVISFIIAIIVYIFSPIVINILAKELLNESLPLVRILCLWVLFGGITSYLGAPVLVSFGYSQKFNISVILSTVVLLILYLNAYLLKVFNIYTFVFILSISEFVILLYRFYYFKNKILKFE